MGQKVKNITRQGDEFTITLENGQSIKAYKDPMHSPQLIERCYGEPAYTFPDTGFNKVLSLSPYRKTFASISSSLVVITFYRQSDYELFHKLRG